MNADQKPCDNCIRTCTLKNIPNNYVVFSTYTRDFLYTCMGNIIHADIMPNRNCPDCGKQEDLHWLLYSEMYKKYKILNVCGIYEAKVYPCKYLREYYTEIALFYEIPEIGNCLLVYNKCLIYVKMHSIQRAGLTFPNYAIFILDDGRRFIARRSDISNIYLIDEFGELIEHETMNFVMPSTYENQYGRAIDCGNGKWKYESKTGKNTKAAKSAEYGQLDGPKADGPEADGPKAASE